MIFRILQTLRRWIFGGVQCPCCVGRGVINILPNPPFLPTIEKCPLCSGWREVPPGLADSWIIRNKK